MILLLLILLSLGSVMDIDIKKFHERIGHCDCLKKTAIIHHLRFKGEFKAYADCSVAKARQAPGESVYLDIGSV
jgi:hypothetical protein